MHIRTRLAKMLSRCPSVRVELITFVAVYQTIIEFSGHGCKFRSGCNRATFEQGIEGPALFPAAVNMGLEV